MHDATVILPKGGEPPGFLETKCCGNCRHCFDLETRDEDGLIDFGDYACMLYSVGKVTVSYQVFPWTVCNSWRGEEWTDNNG